MDFLSALRDGCLGFDASERGRVLVSGPDAAAFLHRLSTQHVADLPTGAGRLNAFVSAKGRMVDLVHHAVVDDGIVLLGSRGRGPVLREWLDRYLFSEKVELFDKSHDGRVIELFGARAPDVVKRLLHAPAPAEPWSLARGANFCVVRTFDRIAAPGEHVPAFLVWTLDGVVDLDGVSVIERDVEDALRIAAGIPGPDGELTDAHNPLDLGLHDAIHWAKGCYIGQEVIARLDTYQKQSKRLVTLTLDVTTGAAVGDVVVVGGEAVGRLTSVAPVPLASLGAALAVARLSPPSEGVFVGVEHGEQALPAQAYLPETAQAAHG